MMRTIFFAAMLSTLSLALGCDSPAAAYCDAKCDCEHCNDDEYEVCEIATEAAIDIAETYGCTDEHDELLTCMIDHGECHDDRFEHHYETCQAQADDYYECEQ